ncbi:RNA polymerase sigma factor [Sphingosinicella rhizophila]|uniref:Sigma-70 family RNA polymerase sigma factor n=1 Tax=Sphingosinicella rhizophila TaxID=3050082 RepID=A0ABU3Q1S2_9SPHN|nr:sigma-70 family RNA polymerase sigma factor [Sphingosinicella sp. GR2756]MDT9597367.1 sigma-70 family RNA polymerase sigma factor [Sphingosinicella sp. GR2756]
MTADRAELKALNVAYRPALIRYFMRRTHNHAEAEDLTQEVFIRLATVDMSVVEKREAYIFQTASNLLRDRSRRERVRTEYREDVQRGEDVGVDLLDPHRVAAGHDMLQTLYAGLAELPERTRRIFTLYRIENVGKKTIAARFGITESAVEKQVGRAMAFLIDRLGDRS